MFTPIVIDLKESSVSILGGSKNLVVIRFFFQQNEAFYDNKCHLDILFQNHAEWIWMVTKEAISNSSLQAYYGFIETQNKSFLKSRESFLRLSHLFITIRTGRS